MEKAAAVDVLKKAIQIDSTNPGKGEKEIATFLKGLLNENGIEATIVENDEGHQSVYASIKASKDTSTTIGFCGHIDTVPIGDEDWKHDPLGAEEVENKIYGRGSSDMKCGTVSMVLSIIDAHKNKTLENNVILLLTGDEEVGMTGSAKLSELTKKEKIDLLVIGEPSAGYVGYVQKGVMGIKVTTEGKAAHSSAPEYGVNAIQHLNAVLDEVFADNFILPIKRHDVLGDPVCNVTKIKGGTGLNVIPDEASFEIEIRTIPGVTKDMVLQKYKAIEEKIKKQIPKLDMKVDIFKEIPSVETDLDDPMIKKFSAVYEDVTGKTPEYVGIPGATDAAMFGVQTVVVSFANPELAHQVDEYVTIDQFMNTIKLYQGILATNFQKSE